MSAAVPPPAAKAAASGWLAALAIYRQPRVLSMLFLGFSAGLPFYLVYQTLSAWLRQVGIQRSTIGMLAWVSILYSVKFLWAPVVDRVAPPLLQRLLGRRRGWMLWAQLGIAVGLLNIGMSDPATGVRQVALWALFTTFWAATQDIALDAWRIESAALQLQGAMLGAYQIGYRAALICGGAGALALAGHAGWHASYSTMAALVGVGVITTLLVPEPRATAPAGVIAREARVIEWLERRAHWPQSLRSAGESFIGAVVCPLLDFFGRYQALGLLILAFVGVYRLTEFTMGSMVNPFYIDRGFSLEQIAAVVKLYGLLMSLVGVLVAGVLIARIGLWRSLLLGSVLIVMSNMGFAVLASVHTPTLLGLAAINALDNLALAMHGTALLAFLSGLTSAKYTATQYALFSSLYALPGKVLEGTSGMVVDRIGYPYFFTYTAALALPGIILLIVMRRRTVAFTPSVAAESCGS